MKGKYSMKNMKNMKKKGESVGEVWGGLATSSHLAKAVVQGSIVSADVRL